MRLHDKGNSLSSGIIQVTLAQFFSTEIFCLGRLLHNVSSVHNPGRPTCSHAFVDEAESLNELDEH